MYLRIRRKVYRDNLLGDMKAYYVQDEETGSMELVGDPYAGGHAVRCERFGQVGSMPVNGYFPYAVMEDMKSDLFWGAQIMHNADWQMEVYRRGDAHGDPVCMPRWRY